MKWFGNDNDGFTRKDFEKIALTLGFAGCIITACATYWISNPHYIDPNFVGFTTFMGLLMVGRKGMSYWKPERYNGTTSIVDDVSEDTIVEETAVSNLDTANNITKDSAVG